MRGIRSEHEHDSTHKTQTDSQEERGILNEAMNSSQVPTKRRSNQLRESRGLVCKEGRDASSFTISRRCDSRVLFPISSTSGQDKDRTGYCEIRIYGMVIGSGCLFMMPHD